MAMESIEATSLEVVQTAFEALASSYNCSMTKPSMGQQNQALQRDLFGEHALTSS
jgi:hypothetical protein